MTGPFGNRPFGNRPPGNQAFGNQAFGNQAFGAPPPGSVPADDAADAVESGDGMLDEAEAAAVLEADIEELERIQAERDQYLDALRRMQADFENYRKRVLREQTNVVERANAGLVEQLLPVLDSFELALANLDDAEEGVRKGVELVFAELLGVLEKSGLRRIETDGQPFDPNVHDAVMSVDGDGLDEPVVVETMRTGYGLKGKVLRPAMVKVAR